MTRLPLLPRHFLYDRLTADIPSALLERAATADDTAQIIERLFGLDAPGLVETLNVPARPRLRDVYAALIDTDRFRIACGRISASYAW
jgi:hypothetical protein